MDIENIDQNQQYQVQLSGKLELFGRSYYPGQPVTLRGDMLLAVADRVASAVVVAPEEG